MYTWIIARMSIHLRIRSGTLNYEMIRWLNGIYDRSQST
jgi:hypothetical protein